MSRSRQAHALVIFGAVALLAGCTSSTGSAISQFSPQSGSTSNSQSNDSQSASTVEPTTDSGTPTGSGSGQTVTVVYPTGAVDSANYETWVQSVAEDANVKVEFKPLSSSELSEYFAGPWDSDDDLVVVGLDDSQTSGLEVEKIGVDYSCVIANETWFDVNQKAMPENREQLKENQWASLLAIESPEDSASSSRWQMPVAQENEEALTNYLNDLKGGGAQLLSTGTAVDLSAQQLVVSSALLPWRTVNNLGTESEWATLPNTCVQRDIFAASAGGDGAQALVETAVTDGAQTQLVQSGIAYPVSSEITDEEVQAVAPRPGQAASVPTDQVGALSATILQVWPSVSSQ